MEKKHTDFLRECAAQLEELKERISRLEEQLARCLEADTPAQEEEVDFTGVQIGEDEDLPAAEPAPIPEPEPEPVPEPVAAPEPAPAPVPSRDPYAWELATPAASVKNIRSGISLPDRALFISTLFKEDYTSYDATVAALNALTSLADATAYVQEHFPDWNLDSDAVFNFMMAVRKKLG